MAVNAAEKPKTTHPRAHTAQPLLAIKDLTVSFQTRNEARNVAVNRLGLTVHPKQTLALVGESGCGKSVTALSVLRLIQSPPGRIESGEIHFDGRDLLELSKREMMNVRGGEIAMIFQEPMTSLNPVLTVGDQIIESIQLHQNMSRREAMSQAVESMHSVAIPRPEKRLKSYPHEFSGGMRQRVMIAMALACHPRLLIADEPTTALDVTIQEQILELLSQIQSEHGISILFISHDLGVVARVAEVVCVMFAGRVVEYARRKDLYSRPLHPYTRALFECRPDPASRKARLATVSQFMQLSEEPSTSKSTNGLKPWWPRTGDQSTEYALCEVEDEHWLACVGTHVNGHMTNRSPDIHPEVR